MTSTNPPPPRDPTELFINRELSWLEFNARVLGEACRDSVPVLEQLKFLTIFSTNLDEFFMVRVAGLKKIVQEDIADTDSPDGRPAQEVLAKIHERTKELLQKQHQRLRDSVLPALAKAGVIIAKIPELSDAQRITLSNYFYDQIFPVLTPLAIDSTHPFPFLSNLSLYLAVILDDGESQDPGEAPLLGLVEVPSIIPRLIPVESPSGQSVFIMLEELIAEHLAHLFIGFSVKATYPIRVTRNLDYMLLESEVVDVLKAIQKEVISREHNEAVRLEVSANCPLQLYQFLQQNLSLGKDDIYLIDGPLVLAGLRSLMDISIKDFRDPPFNPRLPELLGRKEDIFALIAEGDFLLHHPFESFYTVVEFLQSAANDPNVLAIKQTLYRTSGESPIIDALITAAENGKQVTAVVELKARFDEKNNIVWARRLERAGINVVFGFIGLKTHGKAVLVVRKEMGKINRYVHLSTGNYNSTTAKQYTDLSLFTADPVIGNDISAFFNLLTGFNILTGEAKLRKKLALPTFKKVIVSPVNLRTSLLAMIDGEIAAQQKNGQGFIMAKMNALSDKDLITKLYEASQTGVQVRLIVRGICCLRPQVKGLSENIEVISVIDRFLEHSRIFCFGRNERETVYLASADWMPRNMDRRIELCFPVLKPDIRRRIVDQILCTYWNDTAKAWTLNSDSTYSRRKPKSEGAAARAQQEFIDVARAGGIQSIPYELAIRHNPVRKKGVRPLAKRSTKAKPT